MDRCLEVDSVQIRKQCSENQGTTEISKLISHQALDYSICIAGWILKLIVSRNAEIIIPAIGTDDSVLQDSSCLLVFVNNENCLFLLTSQRL